MVLQEEEVPVSLGEVDTDEVHGRDGGQVPGGQDGGLQVQPALHDRVAVDEDGRQLFTGTEVFNGAVPLLTFNVDLWGDMLVRH